MGSQNRTIQFCRTSLPKNYFIELVFNFIQLPRQQKKKKETEKIKWKDKKKNIPQELKVKEVRGRKGKMREKFLIYTTNAYNL